MKTHQFTSIMEPKKKLKLLIVDDHELVSASLANMLETEAQIKVIERANNMEAARKMLRLNVDADIVLMDLKLSDNSEHMEPEGLILAREAIQKLRTDSKIIVVTHNIEGRWIKRAFDMGIKAYLEKNCSLKELLEAIKIVMDGKIYYRGRVRDEMDDYVGRTPPPVEPINLTNREEEILQFLSEGWKTKDIAKYLGIKVNTVETHRSNILHKFDAENVANLMAKAFRLGFLS